jgi:tetratricopeptide (TPR) repeat protein
VREAELMLSEAAERFRSREAYYHLGELHVNSGATDKALEAFQQANVTPGPPDLDPVIEAQMQSFISRRIGDLHGGAGLFDEAIADYNRAFEIDPAIVESRLGLGVVYFRSGRPEEAVEEYEWVLGMDPDNVAALNRLAETLLGLERFEESAEAAMRALEIDPDELTPRYLGGRALVGMGQTEEGARLLREYQALDADRQAEEQRTREIIALDRDAMAHLLEGQHEDGIRMYREAIAMHPDDAQLYFTLGVAQNKLGQHGDAVDTFLKLIDLGLSDDFIIHKNLAAAYQALGDTAASERHEALYVEKRNAEMAVD